MGMDEKARVFAEKGLRIMKTILPPDHLDLVFPMQNLANLQVGLADEGTLVALHTEAIQILERHLGSNSDKVAHAYHNFANSIVDSVTKGGSLLALHRHL
jgi:hypothetical protein